MLSSTALVSLACLLSTGEVESANKLAEGLSQQELVQVQQVIDSGACLPKKFSALINNNAVTMGGSHPTSDFAASVKNLEGMSSGPPTSDYSR